MNQNNGTYYVEDKGQIDALEEFAPKVREILGKYRDQRQLKMIAEKVGVNAARLTEMITTDDTGNYKRVITPYYLAKFIETGIMRVEDILNGRKLAEIPDRARIFFERMILSRKTINLVVEAQHSGIDVDKLLEVVLSQNTD